MTDYPNVCGRCGVETEELHNVSGDGKRTQLCEDCWEECFTEWMVRALGDEQGLGGKSSGIA